jgi:hypothetical protein
VKVASFIQKAEMSLRAVLMVASPEAKAEISSTRSYSFMMPLSTRNYKVKELSELGFGCSTRPKIFSQCFSSKALLPRAKTKLE